MQKRVINLTGSDIVAKIPGLKHGLTFKAEPTSASLFFEQTEVDSVFDIPLVKHKIIDSNLPEEKEDVLLLVPMMVLEALRGERSDLIAANPLCTGTDENGGTLIYEFVC